MTFEEWYRKHCHQLSAHTPKTQAYEAWVAGRLALRDELDAYRFAMQEQHNKIGEQR